ncbi:hypothetical protein A3I27_02795 [Candidatus Giovannonibacteria bacterium RIFCSPLOWO2_02_FULL_43_11b]|uniref:GTP pyrophosphokinase n=1 Tax=Candidatus Giovannonibacteria bacterium RIFCSPHIGHO2_12_FULL_43_15 TaxID=1798341 RepID=A0A1F5WR24_9BACT|nr:MAG: hypothetical protein A2739_00020 [Candidatus Giovannonibacteria bacterium RIFCSPHIGHO2_01_FULL_43_100]OGF66110.1 MAG: hypothetical protein A3B97_01240 [Candidatus Giovannonibacteria bacterium RIFCSPHIGHO2_02_FULL_43_32]OGF78070.1 MAG: hypothetical protein A3F23_02605 [Candidatus Giovannonibacteria bacterium RIFCSPHIGHO2_12_FULL_43_15]OGF78807.1 MAG: hypothetical protein A3A15_02365 [Candidatus Giovannonibacteria bacterium RIFCSPLOWO2_01_FULL_43_60]OGF89138.1 MAG: hypothetical protein A3
MTWEEYEKKLSKFNIAEKDMDILKKAFELALKVHKDEKRISGENYITHPVAVSLKLAELKMDINTIAAGLLHDAVERSPETLKTIKKNLGEELSFLVDGVTKVDRVHATGADRALESVKKMFLAVAEDIRVVIIKLMDRLHNMQTLEWLGQEKQERIAQETLTLYASLAERLGMWNIKAELEDLSMQCLYPKDYATITTEIKKRAPEREKYLKKIFSIIEAELRKEGIKNFQINYRAKHIYSIWQKLKRYEGDWSRFSDLIALRLIVPDVKSCYSALGIIHKLWRPVPGKFRDYIALPKPNGYQSLHTSVFIEPRVIVEFQIRTPEMHLEAESGIAAHWAYAEAGKPKKGFKAFGKKFNWISQLQNWHKEFQKEQPTSEELLEALKIDFFKDRIFTLTPKGDVIDLPRGSTPLDFAYHIHSEIGNRASGSRVNGRMVSFTWELKSGDVVEIITQKNKKPSPEWLGLVKTALAKNRIRRSLRLSLKKSFLMLQTNLIEVRIYGKNRVGFIKDITSVFAKSKINIQNLISARSGNEEAPIKITFVPKNKEELEKIIKKLRDVAGVRKITHLVK